LAVVFGYIFGLSPGNGESRPQVKSQDTSDSAKLAVGIVVFTWPAYAIVWAVAEAKKGNQICVFAEQSAYSVLDIVSKGAFGLVVLYGTGPLFGNDGTAGFIEAD